MAITFNYPTAVAKISDLVVGNSIDEIENTFVTKNFRIGSIVNLTVNSGFKNVQVYENNSEALIGGLVTGNTYRTSDGTLKVVY